METGRERGGRKEGERERDRQAGKDTCSVIEQRCASDLDTPSPDRQNRRRRELAITVHLGYALQTLCDDRFYSRRLLEKKSISLSYTTNNPLRRYQNTLHSREEEDIILEDYDDRFKDRLTPQVPNDDILKHWLNKSRHTHILLLKIDLDYSIRG